MRFTALQAQRVGVWGAGREAQAVVAALPSGVQLVLIGERADDDALQQLATRTGALAISAAQLGEQPALDLLVRSPGVSAYRPELQLARSRGTRVTTMLDLWLHETATPLVIGVTGTKGKSSTSLLIAALLTATGTPTEVGGNIGRPIIELPPDPVVVVEVSSYQATDVTMSPRLGVLTNLGVDHLTWHGSAEAYRRDKLHLFAYPQLEHLVIGQFDDALRAELRGLAGRHHFVGANAVHAKDGTLWRAGELVAPLVGTELEAPHMARNLATAVTAAELALERPLTADEIMHVATSFERPAGRLEVIPSDDGLTWVNDSLASNPFGAAAGIAAHHRSPLVLIIGGGDRGVDPTELLDAITAHGRVRAIVAMGEAGSNWATRLRALATHVELIDADDVEAGAAAAAQLAQPGDVVLFAPAAPTSAAVGTWETRGAQLRAAVATLGSTSCQ